MVCLVSWHGSHGSSSNLPPQDRPGESPMLRGKSSNVENHHFWWVNPLWMMVFNSYVNVYHRVQYHVFMGKWQMKPSNSGWDHHGPSCPAHPPNCEAPEPPKAPEVPKVPELPKAQKGIRVGKTTMMDLCGLLIPLKERTLYIFWRLLNVRWMQIEPYFAKCGQTKHEATERQREGTQYCLYLLLEGLLGVRHLTRMDLNGKLTHACTWNEFVKTRVQRIFIRTRFFLWTESSFRGQGRDLVRISILFHVFF